MAVHDLTPSRGSSSLQSITQRQERFAAGLALIAGTIDAYAFIRFKIYVSFMSGNTTQVGSLAGQGNFTAAFPALLAILCFVFGTFAGTLLHYSGLRQARRLSFGLTSALLVATMVAAQTNAFATGLCIVLLSLAMGLMNTALSHIGAQSVNIVFVTGTLNTLAQHVALAIKRAPLAEAQGEWDTHRRRAFLLMGLWASLLAGSFLGGLVTTYLGVWVLLFPALILIALVASDYAPGVAD